MRKVVKRFRIDYTQFLFPDGSTCRHTPEEYLENTDRLLEMYRHMVLIREFFDPKALALQRRGRVGTNASTEGEEGYAVAYASAITDHQEATGSLHIHVPHYRQNAAMLWLDPDKERALVNILLYWGGDERGNASPPGRRDLPICVPIGTQIGYAAGLAHSMDLNREKGAVVAICGDGATSTGDFHTGLNNAGVFNCPLVILVSNNQYAISVPRSRQTAAETLAQKAIAAGICSEQVDGNDVIGVHSAVYKALERAVAGKGPSLIELLTYRLGAHTTADAPNKYRSPEEVEKAKKFDPILRLKRLMERLEIWDKAKDAELMKECEEIIERATALYEDYVDNYPKTVEELYDHQVGNPHYTLLRERELAKKRQIILLNKNEDQTLSREQILVDKYKQALKITGAITYEQDGHSRT